jgi:outer membrane protein assembly factor BamD
MVWKSSCRIAVLLCAALIGQNCQKQSINPARMPPEEQFENAKKLFDREKYENAKLQFSIIVLNNSGNRVIEKAQFYLAESYFELKDYITASAEYEKMIRSMPQSAFVDDAAYKIGMCYLKLAPSYGLDQDYTIKANEQFERFLEDYPESELKPEVVNRLAETRNTLAKKEFKTGELYFKLRYDKAALISFDAVLAIYPDTEWADDAWFFKGESHRRLQEWDKARQAYETVMSQYQSGPFAGQAEQKLKILVKEQAEAQPGS